MNDVKVFLRQFSGVADAVAQLFDPHAEVVIHDLETDRIFHIANPVSGRQPGDDSHLDLVPEDLAPENIDENQKVIGPYESAGISGQRVRSVTAVLRNEAGKALGLMCINLDYSVYEPALELLEGLIRPARVQQPPALLFQNDWRDQIRFEIRSFLESHGVRAAKLTPALRKDLMAELDGKNLLYAKKSMEQIASILGVSRATAYNDLRAAQKDAENNKG